MTQFNRAFYERDPRAALLRNICLDTVEASTEFMGSNGENEAALSTLLDSNKCLLELGITPCMHVLKGDDQERAEMRARLNNEPVVRAEWLAGQALRAISDVITPLTEEGVTFIEEHDELDGQGGDASLVEVSQLGPNAKHFLGNLFLLGGIELFLDTEAGKSGL